MRPAVQLALLPPAPKDPAKVALWSRGLYALSSLLGMRETKCRKFLGRLEKAAKGNRSALSDLIERAVEARPDDPIPWLVAGARKIGGRVEDWGLSEWYDAAPESVRGWPLDVYEDLMDATGLEPSWQGSLAILTAWVEDGYRPESIIEVIRSQLKGPVYSLRYYDAVVRRSAVRLR